GILGARQGFACGIDPIEVQVARANIERNDEDDIWTFCGSLDAVKSDSVHLLTGNLTSDLIIGLFPEFDRVLKNHAIAILSGILHDQAEEIRELSVGFRFTIPEERSR